MAKENLYTPKCIRTFTGKYVNVFEPTEEMICIEDIAHALSNQPRFGGHLPTFYSVSQHSYLCSRMGKSHNLDLLMHDGSEAYLIDIPKPIKNELSNYLKLEDTLMKLIAKKFGFQYPLHEEVKKIDEQMLHIEWDNLMLGNKTCPEWICFAPVKAEQMFLEEFYRLTKK